MEISSMSGRLTKGGSKPPDPDQDASRDIEITISPEGIQSRSRWPVPWAFALIVTLAILQMGTMREHLPWIVGAGLILLSLWLGLFELRLGHKN
jgi:hypothetical protein